MSAHIAALVKIIDGTSFFWEKTEMRSFFLISTACLVSFAASAQAPAPATLKDAYRGSFVVGAAINEAQIRGWDKRGDAIVTQQFNSITPENAMKWENIHPQPDRYDFSQADKFVEFGHKSHMFIVGHNLCWHSQTPGWVFKDDKGKQIGREALLERLHSHIRTVVGRYKGKIDSWDVVNEALNEDGTLRQSPWLKIIGDDYIVKAFEFAHEADPGAQLNYNDYNLETPAKRKGAIALVKRLQAAGVPIAVVGDQAHLSIDTLSIPTEEATIEELAASGVKVAITELDINVLPTTWKQTADVSLSVANADPKMNPYVNGLPDDVQKKLTKAYGDLFTLFWKDRAVMSRVTLWGVMDGDSWLNNWPAVGRTSYPLLFDRSGKPKQAFFAALNAVKN